MKAPLTLAVLVVCLVVPALAPAFTLTSWQYNGLAVCTAFYVQQLTDCIPDGSGGAFIAWQDRRTFEWDIYVQHVNAFGMTLWAIDGVPVCTAAGNQYDPRLVLDGAGGVIVAWDDQRNGPDDIYAQRVSASGTIQWTLDGIPICTNAGDQYTPLIVSDGAGGAVLVWEDYVIPADIYAQRIDGSGNILWDPTGVSVCTATGYQVIPQAVSDGGGGVIVVWNDSRTGNKEAYGQRIDVTGAAVWPTNGIKISNGAIYDDVRVATDGSGGVLVAWSEWNAPGSRYMAMAHRVGATGTTQWGPYGVLQSVFNSNQNTPVIAPDGSGGAIVVWKDDRNGVDTDLYAQRVSSSGNIQWTGDGIAVCTAMGDQHNSRIVPDGSGGVVAVWEDDRYGGYSDLFTQRLSGNGATRWNVDGEAVCTADYHQMYPLIASDGTGSVIVAFQDARTGNNGDVYAQRIEGRFGYWGHPEPLAASATDVPADQGGKVRVNWFPSDRDVLNQQLISHYSVWRAASAAAVASAIEAGVPQVGLADVGEAFAGPAIREETTASGASAFWELVGTQDAVYLEGYSLTVPTGYDSSAAGPATHDFQVIAHALGSQYFNWPSNVVSGYSVDNLAPPPPLYLTAQRMGNDVQLKWNRVRVPDLKSYAVYRATSSGVSPVPVNFLSSSTDSLLTDTGAPLTTLYYIVTAKDVHENQSAASNEAFVSGATNVGNTPAITQLTVLQNYPNPFAGQTEFQVGLPAPSDVKVEIYDVAGRRVGGTVVHDASAGWQKIPFAGHNERGGALASGVYFYRVTANGSTVTRKMVIAR